MHSLVCCATRGFCTLQISISAGEKKPAFLLLPLDIEVLSIEENKFVLPFPCRKTVRLYKEERTARKIVGVFCISFSCANVP